MEGTRRAVAACCLLLIVLLSGQQQVAAMCEFYFCRCYKKCYADCRTTRGPYPCNFECLQDCVNGQPPPPLPASPADCNDACLIRVCGVMDTATAAAPGDAEACVADCTKKLGGDFAPSAAKTN